MNKSNRGALSTYWFLLAVIGFALTIFYCFFGSTATDDSLPAKESRPNILLMMVDDLGFNNLAINNNNPSITTPNLDKLAKQGVRFTRHYADSVCSTARAALLSGQYPARNGYMAGGRGLSPQLITLPRALKSAGYTTWHIGKWHLGDLQRQAWPDYQGFDHWFGFLNQWRLAGKHKAGEIQLRRPRYQNPWLQGDSEPGAHYPGHLENILTDKAISVMENLTSEKQPWFINLWFYAPHSPIQPAKNFAQLYEDTDAGRYRALVHQLDFNIGRILDYLDTTGLKENTIVVVVSDNGGTNKQIDNNFPYFGTKATFLEGGLRTPLIIRWPHNDSAGTVYSNVIGIQDIFPTLLDSIGEEIPPDLDGRSLFSAISDSNVDLPPKTLFWEAGSSSYGVLSKDGRWRLYLPLSFFVEPSAINFFDLEADPTGEKVVQPVPEEFFAPLKKQYINWHRDVHRVKTEYIANGDGTANLSGMDFLRTPGFGAYTFGVGFSGPADSRLAEQKGVWEMNYDGDKVNVDLGGIKLSGSVDSDKRCHSAVISGVFYRHTCSFCGPDQTKLSLYVDGKHRQTVEVDGAIDVEDPGIPIRLGSAQSLAPENSVGRPIILNIELESTPGWTVDSFSNQLCTEEFL